MQGEGEMSIIPAKRQPPGEVRWRVTQNCWCTRSASAHFFFRVIASRDLHWGARERASVPLCTAVRGVGAVRLRALSVSESLSFARASCFMRLSHRRFRFTVRHTMQW